MGQVAAKHAGVSGEADAPRRLRFDRTSWPYLVVRASGTATAIEAWQLAARLEPWLATRTGLLVPWIDDSEQACAWLDASAMRSMTRWLTGHREELRDRRVAV